MILTEEEDEQDRLRERKNDSIAGLESRECFASRVVWGENKGRRISFAYPACHPDLSGEVRLSTAELGKYVLILQGWVYEAGGGGWRGYAWWKESVGQEGGIRPHLHVCAVPEVLCKKRLQSLTRHAPSGISPIHKPDKMAALPSKVLQGNFHWTNKRSHYPSAPEMSKLPRLLPSPHLFTLPSIPLFFPVLRLV